MKSIRLGIGLAALALVLASVSTACSRHYVVVTPPDDGYSQRDTLRGHLLDDGREIRVTFYFDTIYRTRTVVETDTLWREGARVDTVMRIDTVTRVDTVQASIGRVVVDTVVQADTVVQTDTLLQVDTVFDDALPPPTVDTVVRVDTVEIAVTDTVVRTDTVIRVDTISTAVTDTVVQIDTVVRVDTLEVATVDTVMRTDTLVLTDTVEVVTVDTVTRTDTIEVATVDTVVRVDTVEVATVDTVVRVDTVRVGSGPRYVFVPPGHYPPEGECRVWIPGDPPGQQPDPSACNQLGDFPAAAFVLYGGVAWDAQWDWVATARENPGTVPPEIVAVFRRRGGR